MDAKNHTEIGSPEALNFSVPALIAGAIKRAAQNELISKSAYARRAVLTALQRDGFLGDVGRDDACWDQPRVIGTSNQRRGGARGRDLERALGMRRWTTAVRGVPDDPEVLISAWHVKESSNETDDFVRFCFADLLLHRAKMWRDHGTLTSTLQDSRASFGGHREEGKSRPN